MNLSRWIRHLTYNPVLVRMTRMLCLNRFLRDIYCRSVWTRNKKIMDLSFGGIQAQFYVHTPVELRIIEAPLEKGLGEYYVIEQLFQDLMVGDVFYDIGASLGTHTIFLAKKVGETGRVIAFEPETESYEKLKININLNGLKNVTPIKISIGNSFSEGILYNYGGGFGSFNFTGYGNHRCFEKAKIVPGDFFVKDRKLPLPKAVKIDVEGYEYNVIQGLQRTLSNEACKIVCCEIHPTMLPKSITSNDVIDLLKSYDFRRVQIHPRGQTFHAFCYKELAN